MNDTYGKFDLFFGDHQPAADNAKRVNIWMQISKEELLLNFDRMQPEDNEER